MPQRRVLPPPLDKGQSVRSHGTGRPVLQLPVVVCLLLSHLGGQIVQGATRTPPRRCDETQKMLLTKIPEVEEADRPEEDTGQAFGVESLDSPLREVTRWERTSWLGGAQ